MSDFSEQALDLKYDLLMGRFLLENLPTLKPRSIRIFLCAPFDGKLIKSNKSLSKLFKFYLRH